MSHRFAAALLRWEPSPERLPLMRRPQRGLWPTMSFWLRADVRHFLVPAWLVGLAAAVASAATLGLSPLAAGVLGATLPLLAVGGLERWVRRAAVRRRLATHSR